MRIWYDACTGKHMRYGVAIAKRLRDRGHEVILTTRRHPDTLQVANFLNENPVVIGKYDPKSLASRLKAGLHRQLLFCKFFEKKPPDFAISHSSVDQIRVAFGLGTPIIATVDTVYAEAVNKLTLPLADYIVVSNAIPKMNLKAYNVKSKIVGFNGVDEVAWIKNFTPPVEYAFKKPLIVVRDVEEKAAYTEQKFSLLSIAKKLSNLGNVVYLSRYRRKAIKGLIVPTQFVDSASLVVQADLFVGVGGTITREAALQGTPAIIVDFYQKQYVNDYLMRKGFPIFKSAPTEVYDLAKDLLGKKWNVGDKLRELENPVDIIEHILTQKIGKHT
ncbi:MAG: DUF354 domain-containing protein [Candidatus Bathyarchaeota archaeon]|nr:DUF354 domain-containing protein [Candidatus Bathyarchaeota archaeon]